MPVLFDEAQESPENNVAGHYKAARRRNPGFRGIQPRFSDGGLRRVRRKGVSRQQLLADILLPKKWASLTSSMGAAKSGVL